MKTRPLIALVLALSSIWPAHAQTIEENGWTIALDTSTTTLNISLDGKPLFKGVNAAANYSLNDGNFKQVLSGTASFKSLSSETVSDEFGSGKRYTFTYTLDDGVEMQQQFAFYPGLPYLLTRLTLSASGKTLKSNMLSPVWSETKSTFMPTDNNKTYNRMLFVPYDNDGFVSYQSVSLNKDNDGNPRENNAYSVTSIYNGETMQGLVTGAVDHDTWKNIIHIKGDNYADVMEFNIRSGFTELWATGNMPHGAVVGETVSSARFMMGLFDDWRNGMETFADACQKVAPRWEWKGGKPVGWNSWGVMEKYTTYDGTIDVGNFINDSLRVHAFESSDGKVVLSLDSWATFPDNEMRKFVAYCNEHNMIPGIYMCDFSDWDGDSLHAIGGTSKYVGRDRWLRVHGAFANVAGAKCNDPTHPATKVQIVYDLNRFKKWGIKYIKSDFMSNGAIEADSWYDKNVHTGIQAYNQGMAFLKQKILEIMGDDCYLDLSISPLFPYQYAHGRRISCDAWGSIGQTHYMMNSLSYGWWLDHLYFCNDPDHLVLNSGETDGARRARVTSGVVCGAYLTGDNFSDRVNRGQPAKERQWAMKFFTNPEINVIPRTCSSFRPVTGISARGDGAEKYFQNEDSTYYYFVVMNYDTGVEVSTMSFEKLGIDPSKIGTIKELWTGKTIQPTARGISYNIPGRDARIYRIEKKKEVTGIHTLEAPSLFSLTYRNGQIEAQAPAGIRHLTVSDLSGKQLLTTSKAAADISLLAHGVYLVKAESNNHIVKSIKILK